MNSERAGEYKICEKYGGSFELLYSVSEYNYNTVEYIQWRSLCTRSSYDLAKEFMKDHSFNVMSKKTKRTTKFNNLGNCISNDL